MSVATHLVNGMHLQMGSAAAKHDELPRPRKAERMTTKFNQESSSSGKMGKPQHSRGGDRPASGAAGGRKGPSFVETPQQPPPQQQDGQTASRVGSARPSMAAARQSNAGLGPNSLDAPSQLPSRNSLFNTADQPEIYDKELEKDITLALTPAQATELHQLASRYKMALALIAMRDLERTMDGDQGFSKSFVDTQTREEQEGLKKSKLEFGNHLVTCGVSADSKLYQRILQSTEQSVTKPNPNATKRTEREFSAKELGLRKPSVGAGRGYDASGGGRTQGLFSWDLPQGVQEDLLDFEAPPPPSVTPWKAPVKPPTPPPEQPAPPPEPEPETDPVIEDPTPLPVEPNMYKHAVLPPIARSKSSSSSKRKPQQQPPKRPASRQGPTATRSVTPQVFAPLLRDQMTVEGSHGMPQFQNPTKKPLPSSDLYGILKPEFAGTYYHKKETPHPQDIDTLNPKPEPQQPPPKPSTAPSNPHQIHHINPHLDLEENIARISKTTRIESGGFMYAGYDARAQTAKTVKELTEHSPAFVSATSTAFPTLGARIMAAGAVQMAQGRVGASAGASNGAMGFMPKDMKCVGHHAFMAKHLQALSKISKR
ncbi:hypothetical protein HDU97_003306 [Phlyctochytrium planicorne]|nr:hypothetical protein HDU97_003306 [Phlyctochytrium planicorne]